MPFDLPASLARVGFDGPREPGADGLAALHRAHVLAVPFENLDVQMGLPIRLDADALFEKLVARRRGGYCFEQNTLFLAALSALGFDAIACEARVASETDPAAVRPRTHMVLVVRTGAGAVLCDVGFGGDGPLEPVPLDGREVEQLGDRLRVEPRASALVLRLLREGTWRDVYAFVPEERFPVDFEVASWYTSTHPGSRFVTTLTAQLIRPDGRHVLRNLDYSVRLGSRVSSRTIRREELLPLLREAFGVDLPEGSRFRALDP